MQVRYRYSFIGCRSVFAVLMALFYFGFFFPFKLCAETAFAPSPDTSQTYRILLINSYHQGFQWTDDITTAVISTLSERLPKMELFIEYLDSKRFFSDADTQLFGNVIARKYSKININIIITSDDNALQFVLHNHDSVFSEIPVVFCGVNQVADALRITRRYCTGIVETLDIEPNLEWVRDALPCVRRIVVVSDGTSTGLGTRQVVKDASKSFPDLEFVYLNGEELKTEQMLDAINRLDKMSIVLAPAWYLGTEERFYDNKEIYPLMSRASSVPIIGLSSANLGLGILGGKMNSGMIQGNYVADLATKILLGEVNIRDLPIHTQSQNLFMFDYRQMKRFGIDERLLPPGSKIVYQPFSFFRTYRKLVISVIVSFILFSVMIGWLLIMVRRLRRARIFLAGREAYFRTILNSIGDAVVVTDNAGTITQMNPPACQIFGRNSDSVHGKRLGESVCLIDEESSEIEDPVMAVLIAHDYSWSSAKLLFIDNDRTVNLRGAGSVIKSDSGDTTGVVLVFRDISEELLLDAEIRQSQKMEAVGRLAGGIAHDFNNMLGGILGSAELARLEIPDESPVHELINTIIAAAQNAAGLTRKLLTFSRKGVAVFTLVDIHDCIENALGILERSLDRQVRIQQQLTANSYIAMGDPGQIQNAIINLGINAGQAMAQGGILSVSTSTIELSDADCNRNQEVLQPGCYIVITVSDTGEGISEEVIPKIFDPFFTTKRVGKGTGLGLAAVFGIVKEHHGTISVDSTVGKGSCFKILLPLVQDSVTFPDSPAVPVLSGNGNCILVIDDESVVRFSVVRMLKGLGYTVLEANDGREGVDVYRENKDRIELVLLDMVMPEMNGRECFTEIRKIYSEAKILVSSGYSSREDMDDICAKGAIGVLRKPYQRKVLAAEVAKALATHCD